MALDLIYDRTEADATRVRDLKAKGYEGWTPEELAEWLLNVNRGAYNETDYNRVESAVRQLSDMFIALGYAARMETKTDWAETCIPAPSELDRYIRNIATLRSILPVLPGTPEAPGTMDGFDWAMANDIERILFNIEKPLTYISTYTYQRVAATFYAGGGVTLQKFSRGR